MKFNNIHSLTLYNGGFSGGKLIYTIAEGGDKIFNNGVQKTNYSPTPQIMEVLFNQLRVHAMRICEIWSRVCDHYYDFATHGITEGKPEKEAEAVKNKLNKCRIDHINFKDGGFILKFSYKRFDGEYLKFSTELVGEEYDYFDVVMGILHKIAHLAVDWADMKLATETERVRQGVVMTIHKVDPIEALDIINNWTEEEKDEFSKKHLEEKGHMIVSMNDALENRDDDVQDAEEVATEQEEDVEEVPAAIPQMEEDTEIPESQIDKGVPPTDDIPEGFDQDDPEEVVIPSIPGVDKS
jgi:hypothetical protein